MKRSLFILLIYLSLHILFPLAVSAQDTGIPIPFVDVLVREASDQREVALSLEILLLISILSIAPALIISMTSYVRLIIVFDFVKRGLGTQQMPPAQILAGIALFLTIFIMMPVFKEINTNALQPYTRGEISLDEMYEKGVKPLREFMFKNADEDNIGLFMNVANLERPETFEDVPTYVLVPSFILSELKTAFQMGIFIMIPFMLIDMLVSATLMSMGMIMLPPVMISLPFKIIVFLLIDGWNLVIGNLVQSFG